MGFVSDEKRKNDQPRRFQWWLLVIGFVLGVILTLIFTPSRTTVTVQSGEQPNYSLTATHIVAGATGTAAARQTASPAAPGAVEMDDLMATATTIIQQATLTSAAATAQSG